MSARSSEEDDALLVHAGPSRAHSRVHSGRSSAVGSARTSMDHMRKFRLSDEDTRTGMPGFAGVASHSAKGSRGARSSIEEDGIVLFKVAGEHGSRSEGGRDDDADERSASAPLLSAAARRGSSADELDELERIEGPQEGGAKGSLMDGIANMANSIVGAGIVGLPYALSQAGFVMGVGLLIGLAVVTDWRVYIQPSRAPLTSRTIRLVVLNAKLSGRDSYTGVMQHCFGPAGAAAVSFFQFAFAFGGSVGFLRPARCDSIPHVIAYIFPSLAGHAGLSLLVNRNFIIVLMTITISFPLSLHRDIAKLSKSSSFALISMTVIVTSVVLRGVAVDPSLRGSSAHIFSFIRPGVFQAIGVISFAFVCHHNTMFIYQSIETPTLDRFNAVTHASTGMALIGCLLMAVTGYVVFTDKVQGNILNNFSPDDLVINIARLCFGANMSTTIPLENYVCREVIEDALFKGRPFSYRRHVILTVAIVFCAMSVSLITCDLGIVLELAGGLSATALAFIFPASAFYVLTRGEWYSRQKLPAVICAIFGAVVLVLSCGLAIAKALTGGGESKVCT